MADFVNTMRQMFGYNPATGETLQGARLPGPLAVDPTTATPATPSVTGDLPRPFSPEAADPGTPSPSGRVLARLRTPMSQAPRLQTAAGDESLGSALASQLAAGVDAVKPGMDKGGAFVAGLAGGLKSIQSRAEAHRKAQAEERKSALELYKTMFDVSNKIQAQQRGERQDAETKRWHDIMAPSYAADADKKAAKELSPKDAVLTEQRLRQMSGYDPTDENWQYLKPAEQKRRQTMFERIYRNTFNRDYPIDENGNERAPAAPEPKPGGGGLITQQGAPRAGAVPAPTSADSEDEDAGAEEGSAAPKPKIAAPRRAGQPQPPAASPVQQPPAAAVPPAPASPPDASAGPQVWRKALNKADGSLWLIGPNGERKPLAAEAPQEYPPLSGD